jgi:hypothetical protein
VPAATDGDEAQRVACWHPLGTDGLPVDGTRGDAVAAAVPDDAADVEEVVA